MTVLLCDLFTYPECRWWITHNGRGGGGGDTLAEALKAYRLALKFAGKPYAYRGGAYQHISGDKPC